MFYAGQLLSQGGPLQVVWLAAHGVDRQLKRQQVSQASIPAAVDRIVLTSGQNSSGVAGNAASLANLGGNEQQQEGSLALRLTGQLLLGLVRVYNRKMVYLQEDAEGALYLMQDLNQMAKPSAAEGEVQGSGLLPSTGGAGTQASEGAGPSGAAAAGSSGAAAGPDGPTPAANLKQGPKQLGARKGAALLATTAAEARVMEELVAQLGEVAEEEVFLPGGDTSAEGGQLGRFTPGRVSSGGGPGPITPLSLAMRSGSMRGRADSGLGMSTPSGRPSLSGLFSSGSLLQDRGMRGPAHSGSGSLMGGWGSVNEEDEMFEGYEDEHDLLEGEAQLLMAPSATPSGLTLGMAATGGAGASGGGSDQQEQQDDQLAAKKVVTPGNKEVVDGASPEAATQDARKRPRPAAGSSEGDEEAAELDVNDNDSPAADEEEDDQGTQLYEGGVTRGKEAPQTPSHASSDQEDAAGPSTADQPGAGMEGCQAADQRKPALRVAARARQCDVLMRLGIKTATRRGAGGQDQDAGGPASEEEVSTTLRLAQVRELLDDRSPLLSPARLALTGQVGAGQAHQLGLLLPPKAASKVHTSAKQQRRGAATAAQEDPQPGNGQLLGCCLALAAAAAPAEESEVPGVSTSANRKSAPTLSAPLPSLTALLHLQHGTRASTTSVRGAQASQRTPSSIGGVGSMGLSPAPEHVLATALLPFLNNTATGSSAQGTSSSVKVSGSVVANAKRQPLHTMMGASGLMPILYNQGSQVQPAAWARQYNLTLYGKRASSAAGPPNAAVQPEAVKGAAVKRQRVLGATQQQPAQQLQVPAGSAPHSTIKEAEEHEQQQEGEHAEQLQDDQVHAELDDLQEGEGPSPDIIPAAAPAEGQEEEEEEDEALSEDTSWEQQQQVEEEVEGDEGEDATDAAARTGTTSDGFLLRTRHLLHRIHGILIPSDRDSNNAGQDTSELGAQHKPGAGVTSLQALLRDSQHQQRSTSGHRRRGEPGTRIAAARSFVDILVLQNRGFIKLSQTSTFGDINISARPKLSGVTLHQLTASNSKGAAPGSRLPAPVPGPKPPASALKNTKTSQSARKLLKRGAAE